MPHLQIRLYLIASLFGLWLGQFEMNYTILLISLSVVLILHIHLKKWCLIALITFLTSILIAIHHSPSTIHQYKTQANTFTGYVSAFPDIRLDHQKIILKTKDQNLLLHLTLDQKIRYGDQIEIKGKPSRPPKIKGFDYRKYLEQRGISAIIRFPKPVKILCQGCRGNAIIKAASQMRETLGKNLEVLPSPHRELAMGILLGIKKELPPSIQKAFQDSGLQHILVVSGSNIALVMLCFQRLFRRFGPWICSGFSIFGILFFVLMAGGDPPVVRAAIMGSLAGISVSGGRLVDGPNVLLLSGVLMGFWNPAMVQSDLGFWLSFSATMGIMVLPNYFAMLWHKYYPPFTIYYSPLSKIITDVFTLSLAAQIGVLPLLTIFFGDLPTGTLIANLLVEPLMAYLMLISALLGIGGWLPILIIWPLKIMGTIGFAMLMQIAKTFSILPKITIPPFLQYPLLILILSMTLFLLLCPKYAEPSLENHS